MPQQNFWSNRLNHLLQASAARINWVNEIKNQFCGLGILIDRAKSADHFRGVVSPMQNRFFSPRMKIFPSLIAGEGKHFSPSALVAIN